MSRMRSGARLAAIQLAFAIGIVAVIARAVQIQIVRGAAYAEQARATRTETVALPARRGTVFDRTGTPLALTHETYHVGIAPRELRHPEEDMQRIRRQLGLSPREADRALRRTWAYFHGPFTSSQVHPLRGIRGVHLTRGLERFHPDPDFARPVLGRPADDGRPASGLERVLDSVLTGIPGRAVVLRDRQGRRYESPSRLDAFPVPGYDVELTLDVGVQEIVGRALVDAIALFRAAGGDVVVMDPTTGEVLAVASRRADGSQPASAFTSVFEPGSTAKIFAAAALLAAGRVNPTDSVWGEDGRWVLPHRTIQDEHPVAWMNLDRAIRVSSNIGAAKFASRLLPEEQYITLRDFGFGSPTGIELPVESRGLLPPPHQWSATSAASLAMGYELAVTPLQLAQAYAAIANRGVMLRPALVRRVRRHDGKVSFEHRPEPVRRVVSEEIADRLREMLRGAVAPTGTGSSAALVTYEVAGKTGTARVAGPGGYIPGSYVAVFAALFPADDPQLVTVVKLDDPRGTYASLTAAPVTRRVLEQVLAAHTGAIDRRRLAGNGNASPAPQPAPVEAGSVPYVVAWPNTAPAEPPPPRLVPEVVGLPLREAVRHLHKSGLNARTEGRGRVLRVVPAVGEPVPAGTVVTLVAEGESW